MDVDAKQLQISTRLNDRHNDPRTQQVRLSSAHLLPFDILSEIFLHLAYLAPGKFIFPCIQLNPPSILQVCRQWRSAAQSTSLLYTKLTFNHSAIWYHSHAESHRDGDGKCLEAGNRAIAKLRWAFGDGLKQWIMASKDSPLEIVLWMRLVCRYCHRYIIQPAWIHIFHVLNCSSRWISCQC